MAKQLLPGHEIEEHESRMDFTTIPNSQLDTYISYYELAPSFPPPLDPLPSTGDDDNGEEHAELEDYLYSTGPNGNGVSSSSSSFYTSQRKRDAGEISGDGSTSRNIGKTRAERERSRRKEREQEAAYEEAQIAKRREREARERENMGLPPEQPLGRRAAAAAASTRMRGDIMDPFGDRDSSHANDAGTAGPGAGGYGGVNGSQAYGGGYPGAGPNGNALHSGAGGPGQGQGQGPGTAAGPLPGDDPPCPESFFDGEAANNYLSAVSSKHFVNLPHPKEGEIVVGFLYKCRTKGEFDVSGKALLKLSLKMSVDLTDKILKIA